MTIDLNQRKKTRFLFLKSLYEGSNGDTRGMFDMMEIGSNLNIERDETRRIVEYLIGENLITSRALGGIIGLTHIGLKEVEQAIESPDKPTEHFLPINIINIGTMNNSSLQQATENSTLNYTFNDSKISEIEPITNRLKEILDTLNVSDESKKELSSEIQTLEIQRQSPRPKNIIISESLKTIRTILENAAGSVAGNALTHIIGQITHLLS